MKGGIYITAAWLLCGALLACAVAGAQPANRQSADDVKVAVLLRLAHFVEWPDEVSPEATNGLDLCVLGRDRWLALLRHAADGETYQGVPVRVRRVARPEEANSCHMVVIGSPANAQPWDWWKQTHALTVGEQPGFAVAGGIVNLVTRRGHVHFELNPEAAKASGIRLSSKLLRLATLVEEEER